MEIEKYKFEVAINEISNEIDELFGLLDYYMTEYDKTDKDKRTATMMYEIACIQRDLNKLLRHRRRMELHEQYRRWITERRS